jgi:CBS domain-containing protein
MREDHVGDLIVVEERDGQRVPVGILTDRDLVVGVLAKDGVHGDKLDVGDVLLGTPLLTAREDEDLSPVLQRMRAFYVRRVPVLDESGRLAGILSLDDAIAALTEAMDDVAALVSSQPRHEAERRP